MGYHGIIWASMGKESILFNVLIMFL